MIRNLTLALCASLTLLGTTADAEQVFRHKNWTLSVDEFGDGMPYCTASGASAEGSFEIVAIPFQGATLHIFFPDADFGMGMVDDLYLQIDGGNPWTLYDAEFEQQSVFFGFPDEYQTTRFIAQLMGGRRVYLLNADGRRIWSFSLAGSYAALVKLGECKAYFEGE